MIEGPAIIAAGAAAFFGADFAPPKYQRVARYGGIALAGIGALKLLFDAGSGLFDLFGTGKPVGKTAEYAVPGNNDPQKKVYQDEAIAKGMAEAPDGVQSVDANGMPTGIKLPPAAPGEGIMAGGLAVGVSAQIKYPGVGGQVSRGFLRSVYEVELEIANFLSTPKSVVVDIQTIYSTAGFDDRRVGTPIGTINLAASEVRRIKVNIDSQDVNGGIFDLPASVAASVYVNNVITQSTYFRMT